MRSHSVIAGKARSVADSAESDGELLHARQFGESGGNRGHVAARIYFGASKRSERY